MLNKKIAANNMIPLNEKTGEKHSCGGSCNCFKTGSKFCMNDQTWTVVEEFECANTPMRKISSDNEEIEIVMLKTLQKDAKFNKGFKNIED